jgi:hypothetical protein
MYARMHLCIVYTWHIIITNPIHNLGSSGNIQARKVQSQTPKLSHLGPFFSYGL